LKNANCKFVIGEVCAMSLRLVILDRDDTLIRLPLGRRYVAGDDPFELAPGAAEFVGTLNRAGIVVVVVTNQQGVALAECPEITVAAVERLHSRIQEALAASIAGRVARPEGLF
jgi:histidinol phosphatase-like enzyme